MGCITSSPCCFLMCSKRKKIECFIENSDSYEKVLNENLKILLQYKVGTD